MMSGGIMGERVVEGSAMIAGMSPELMPGRFVFLSFQGPVPTDISNAAIASFREAEGWSIVAPAELAPDEAAMALITLQVHSALEGVGLTAAVSVSLAEADIPCNVVAAFHHDHIFVPEDCAERAVSVLKARASSER